MHAEAIVEVLWRKWTIVFRRFCVVMGDIPCCIAEDSL